MKSIEVMLRLSECRYLDQDELIEHWTLLDGDRTSPQCAAQPAPERHQ